jgi:AcrR family transcriptional regulator
MSANAVKITTVDRILDASLKLFNEQGFHRVPAMRIAEHLGISPGHLAYHFKNKTDILLALFPRMERAMQDLLQIELPHVAPVSIDRTLSLLKTFWNYRFFFIELPQIAPIDDRIMKSYATLEDHIIETMRKSLDRRIAEGAMTAIPPPNTTELLAKNTWGTWLDWIRREQLRNPGQQTPSAASVYEIMLRGYCILQPFLAPDFLEEAIVSLKKRLAKAEEEGRAGNAEAGAVPKKRRKTTA